MMLELSPDDTAANASASSIPALSSTSRSKPRPTTRSPAKSGLSRPKALLSLSITATSWPRRDIPSANDDPTRPHPITTTRTCGSSREDARPVWAGALVVRRTVPAIPGGLTLFSRVQTFDRGPPAGFGSAVSQRSAGSHTATQADRLAGVRFRCVVLGGLRPRGGLSDALGGRAGGVFVDTVDRAGGGGSDAGRGGQLPAERPCLPFRWR